MSKITNEGLTRSGTGCFIAVAVPIGNSGHQIFNDVATSQENIVFEWPIFLVYVT